MRTLVALIFFVLCLTAPPHVTAQSSSPSGKPQMTPAPGTAPTEAIRSSSPERITAYTLPPERYEKAHHISRLYFRYLLISFFYGLAVLWLILRFKIGSRYRGWAVMVSSRRFVQALVFVPMLLLT